MENLALEMPAAILDDGDLKPTPEWARLIQDKTQKGISMNKTEHRAHTPIAAAGWRRTLFYLLQFTWGLPVNIVGLLVFLCCRRRFRSERFHNSIVTYLPGERGGLSLGIFIFLDTHDVHRLLVHEYGHTVQCLFLGPLYWIVIMLPSVTWYHFFAGYRRKCRMPYDAFYCERWATAWGKQWSGLSK